MLMPTSGKPQLRLESVACWPLSRSSLLLKLLHGTKNWEAGRCPGDGIVQAKLIAFFEAWLMSFCSWEGAPQYQEFANAKG